jgi:hypothetical protein
MNCPQCGTVGDRSPCPKCGCGGRLDIDEQQAVLRQVFEAKGIMPEHMFTWEFWNGMALTWDIDKAKEFAKSNKVFAGPPPEAIDGILKMNGAAGDIDDEHALTRDLDTPLIYILSPFPPPEVAARGEIALICIDGWHRLRKALITKHPHPLPIVVLAHEQERACRLATTLG